jgi:hypothetical protein
MGNPPYVSVINVEEDERPYYLEVFDTAIGRFDLYVVFVECSLKLLNHDGSVSFIMPIKFSIYANGKPLRKLILKEYELVKFLDISQCIDIFEEPSTYPCIAIIRNRKVDRHSQLYVLKSSIPYAEAFLQEVDQILSNRDDGILIEDILQDPDAVISPSVTGRIWSLLKNLQRVSQPVGDFYNVEQAIRIGNPKIREKLAVSDLTKISNSERRLAKPILDGENIDRYTTEWPNTFLIYKKNDLYNPKTPKLLDQKKILVKRIANVLSASWDSGDNSYGYFYPLNTIYILAPNQEEREFHDFFILGLLNSNLFDWIYRIKYEAISVRGGYIEFRENIKHLPIRHVSFTTPTGERERLTQEAIGTYDIGDDAGVLRRVQVQIDSNKADVVHDLLAHLAQRMIDLNRQKQGEIKRFLGWLEKRLQIRPDKNGATGIDSLTAKTILQAYLGDYQKGDAETAWREFYYRLNQNRNRFAVSLSDVEGEIQREYEKSLATLLPIKRDLARTNALIDKIVYRLYGLTDEEIELIEHPQYEQALADAKAQVVADEAITDDEEKIEKIAAGILPAARRFFERVEPTAVEVLLDSELPNWRNLPPEAPTFLLTGDYNLRTLPGHMDFSTSIIPYTKAAEVVLSQLIFIPFRQQYTDVDCTNDFLKKFMRGEKDLTLGSFMIILSSSRETALRNFISRIYTDAATRVFGAQGLVNILNDEQMRDIRNKAAHDEVLSRDEAQQTRSWVLKILEQV